MSRRKFLVSVVMAVYNTEEYVEEAIQSLLDQTIGFKKNIQLILVNDGSTDRSGAICRRYARLYPENVVYKKTHNHGAAAARNYGLRFATGEWVNFLDSDDKWGKCAFRAMQKFAQQNPDVDVMAPRMRFFEARHDYHMLDYKFSETRVIDIEQEPSMIQMHGAQCWYRRSAIGEHRFDCETIISEDAKFFAEIVLQLGKYGVVRDARYHYRRRKSESNCSLIQSQRSKPYFYKEALDQYFFYYIRKYSDTTNGLPKYLQHAIVYDLKWRLWEPIDEMLCDDPEAYRARIKEILQSVDDDVIMSAPILMSEQKVYMLEYKHGKKPELSISKGRIYCRGVLLNKFQKRGLRVDCVEYRADGLRMFGRLTTFLANDRVRFYVDVDGERHELPLMDNPNSRLLSFDGVTCLEARAFECTLPHETAKISFICIIDGEHQIRMQINTGKFAKLNTHRFSYYCAHGHIVRLSKTQLSLYVRKATRLKIIRRELLYQLNILYRKCPKAIIYRNLYWFMRIFKKKQLWIVSDRADMANDNGEAMFRYISKQKYKDIDCRFRIEPYSCDYERIKKIGKVAKYNSLGTKIRILLADKLISSHIDDFVFRPFLDKNDYWLSDLRDYDMVFLQHGITKDDLSGWLIRNSKNIKLFVTATRPEYESIVNGNYLYDERQIKLTGFARHDRLMNGKREKQIIVIPTWRRSLAGWYSLSDGVRTRNEEFTNSEYYQFYDRLINDKRILAAMKRFGYKGLFVTHPNHLANADDFHANKIFDVSLKPIEYSSLFANGALMVTDYSSVAFEFAYLNKPIIYSQFDREKFFKQHVYTEGYFSYERDGFGPVCYDYESTVAVILDAIQNDCGQPKQYAKRVAKTFAYHDDGNCERIYYAIRNLDKPCKNPKNQL